MMSQKEIEKSNQAVYKLVGDLFSISALYNSEKDTVVTIIPRYNKNLSLKLLKERLNLAGYIYSIDEIDDQIILRLNSQPTFKIPPLNIFLFFATLFSIYIVPVFLQQNFSSHISYSFNEMLQRTFLALKQGDGIIFTIAMISILFVHEMGHYIASRRRNIITSWPYFIPAPNIIGTFGAIIKSKSPFWNRRDLIEVGAWGPIAGWVVALAWTIYGILTATIKPVAEVPESGYLGEPLIFDILSYLMVHTSSEHFQIIINDAIFAGWVGMLVTALNMLPIGQLDGGHVVYGLIKKRQHLVGYIAMGVLFLLGFDSQIWWLFAGMGVIFGVKHPPTLNDSQKLSKSAIILAISALLILILSFTPIPFR